MRKTNEKDFVVDKAFLVFFFEKISLLWLFLGDYTFYGGFLGKI